MYFDESRFFSIITKKHFGDQLTPEEEDYFRKAIKENPAAQPYYDAFIEACADSEFRAHLEHNNLREQAKSIIKARSPRKRKSWLPYLAAACFAAVIVFAVFIMVPSDRVHSQYTGSIVLQLSTGEEVIIPKVNSGTKTVETNSGTLKVDSVSLTIISSKDIDVGLNTLKVPDGKRCKLTLIDKSVVEVNAGSSITFPLSFSNGNRQVSIQGEGYFRIVADPAKPFIVHAKNSFIEVLGTEFNVNAYDTSSIIVALTKGSIRVNTPNERIIVEPGNQAVMVPNKRIGISKFDSLMTIGWLQGEYVFHETKLRDVLNVLSRQYAVPVVYENPQLGHEKLSGGFSRAMTFEKIVACLNKAVSIHACFKGDTLYVMQ